MVDKTILITELPNEQFMKDWLKELFDRPARDIHGAVYRNMIVLQIFYYLPEIMGDTVISVGMVVSKEVGRRGALFKIIGEKNTYYINLDVLRSRTHIAADRCMQARIIDNKTGVPIGTYDWWYHAGWDVIDFAYRVLAGDQDCDHKVKEAVVKEYGELEPKRVAEIIAENLEGLALFTANYLAEWCSLDELDSNEDYHWKSWDIPADDKLREMAKQKIEEYKRKRELSSSE